MRTALTASLVVGALAACQFALDLRDEASRASDAGDAGADAAADVTGADAMPADAGGLAPAIEGSCREIKARVPTAASGRYALVGRDGGFYCDMESFDGGWTLVRPDMVLSEGTTRDVAPQAPSQVAVSRGIDSRGGASWEMSVSGGGCPVDGGQPPAFHWFLVDDIQTWRQIMATYTFEEGVACWNMFGDLDRGFASPNINVHPFDMLQDTFDRDQNMARTLDGGAIPFDGTHRYCDVNLDNFWHPVHRAQPRTIRLALRRNVVSEPAGLSVAAACGTPKWTIREVFVR